MIIQSLDGKWYINPVFKDNDTLVQADNDGVQFFRRGPPVSWKTAVKSLTKLGLRAGFISGPEDSLTVLGESLVQAGLYNVMFVSPIPTPHHYFGVLNQEPLMSDQRVLKWPRSRRL